MNADLNLDGHQITYLKQPEHDHNASTKGYAHTNCHFRVEMYFDIWGCRDI